jgi:hypothetical protein
MKQTTYELVGEWANLDNALNDAEDDAAAAIAEGRPREDGLIEALEQAVAQLSGDAVYNVTGLIRLVRNAADMEASIKREEERLAARRKTAQARQLRLRSYLAMIVGVAPGRKIKTTIGTVTITNGKPSVVIDDVMLLPPGTYTIPTEIIPDKRAIKELIEAGNDVPGAHIEIGEPVLVLR